MAEVDMECIFDNSIRERFIESFVERNLHYNQYIAELQHCSDGDCYIGYLWDCIKMPSIVSEEKAWEIIKFKNDSLYVMGDINSQDRIFIKNYWKYPKHAVLFLDGKELENIKDTLPEDFYVFDKSFSWTIAFTHEFVPTTTTKSTPQLMRFVLQYV